MSIALAEVLQRAWWRPAGGPLAVALAPLASLVSAVALHRRRRAESDPGAATPLPVPVIVVGNVIVGGAGKTPTVIALVAQLRAWGFVPGIVSRGYGRSAEVPTLIDDAALSATTASEVGDEPLLMQRRTGAPIAVGRARREAAEHLLAVHPEVNVVVADDGLQHHALPRDIEIIVFDGRGIGNGRVLPAGPLREPIRGLWAGNAASASNVAPASASASASAARSASGNGTPSASASANDVVVANGAATSTSPARLVLLNGDWPPPPALPSPTPLARTWRARRALAGAVALDAWSRGAAPTSAALDALRGVPVVAAAGIGEPGRFFSMLAARGLHVTALPLPDHARYETLPWPIGTPDVVVTEKDAVKLVGRPLGATRVWVVPLDFAFDPDFAAALSRSLDEALARRRRRPGNVPSAAPEDDD